MGVRWTKTNIGGFNKDDHLRLDPKYRIFADKKHYAIWDHKPLIRLSDVLTPLKSPKFKKGFLGKSYKLIDLANIERRTNSLINIEESNHIGSDKNLIKNGHIVIPKLEPRKGQFFLNLTHDEYLGSTEFVEYKIDTKMFNPTFLFYLLVTPSFLESLKYLESGKTHRRVNSADLLKLQIPKIPIEKQNKIVEKIILIKQDIKALKESRKDTLEIINEVFGEELGFDWKEFEKIKKQKMFTSSLLEFSNNIDCRFAFRFQHQSGKFMMSFLKSKTSKRIKDYLKIPISLGSGISPSQYEEEGEYYYISMATVKNHYFEKNDAKKVSLEYANNNQNKTVQKNDIIMTRSGMAIGKFALIEDENIKGIYADFTMRIRLKNYIPRLAYYYFRSDFFQYLIATHKKGLQNHNIFPNQIEEFPIPDWPKDKQTEVVEKIQSKIDSQKEIDKQIEKKQKQISELIESAIKQKSL